LSLYLKNYNIYYLLVSCFFKRLLSIISESHFIATSEHVENGQKRGIQTDPNAGWKRQKTRNIHFPAKYKANNKLTVNYENSAIMPITSLLMATNSERHWFIDVCIPGLFCLVLQCVS
jgi:hypothetical protein